jgi:hypothetical protein
VGISLSEYCAEHGLEALLSQWDWAANGTLTPEMVTAGCHRKVWRQCMEGHDLLSDGSEALWLPGVCRARQKMSYAGRYDTYGTREIVDLP